MTNPLPDGYVVHLPAPSRITMPRHQFGEHSFVPADPKLDRHPQTERTCAHCKTVKITVHPPEGGGYRLWRAYGCDIQIEDEPACEIAVPEGFRRA